MMSQTRRAFLTQALKTGVIATASGASLSACSRPVGKQAPRVVIVGGGYGGATCAKYIRYFDNAVHVTLIESSRRYHTCPFSNAVLGGLEDANFTTQGYEGLKKTFNIHVIHDTATSLNPIGRRISLAGGATLPYDRLITSPGISFRWDHVFSGYDKTASDYMPHAWRGGEQLTLLKRQLLNMEDGGVFAIVVPGPPFRCPPGPYERASLVASYLKQAKPKSKVLILDANEHFSKQDLFEEAWAALYENIIERIPISAGGLITGVDVKNNILKAEAGDVKVAIANVIPFQQAGKFAIAHNLTDETGWCPVDHKTFESKRIPGVHVLGDSALAGAMPKSASSANSQAKVCSLAVVDLLRGREPDPMFYHNTCYSLITADYGISINAMYRYEDNRIKLIERSGGPSPLQATAAFRRKEAHHARGWYQSINADSFGR